MTEMTPTPRAMKKAIDFCRPATTITPAYARGAVWRINDVISGTLRGDFPLEFAVYSRYLNSFGDAQTLQQLESDPGGIELIPHQAMPCRGRMRVVVIVPALA